MYTIHADGQKLFDSLSEDIQSIALSPKLSLDVNKAGSLSFVLPPGNSMHRSLKKLKSIVTVEQDGVQLARGRVTETELDVYNQNGVYCEGEKSFLCDSLHAPYSYSGKVHGLFQKLIDNHNSMVDEDRQFTVGTITAVGDSETTEVETGSYANTYTELEDRLLNVYGGYLRTRTVGSTHYIDWVKEYGETNSQPIEFSVNLLDLTDKADAGDVFTVLIPLGASEIGEDGEYTEPVSVASVNNGLNYIQDDEAVALYGKIWKTYSWSYIDDPAKLLEKAQEYLKTGVALETLTLKAVDMHFTDGNIQPIRIGDKVHILSNPHGIDRVMVCSQIEIDLLNPENTLYTFGEPPRTLTDNFVKTEEEVDGLTGGGGGGRKSVQEEISDIIRWAKINVDEANAKIELTAGELNKTNQNVSAVAIRMDGVEAEIEIAASRLDNVEDRTTSAEIRLDGAEAAIKLKADLTVTTELAERMSQAEIDIDGANASIALKASQSTVDVLDDRVTEAEAELVVQSDAISTKVSKDGVISSINQTAESIVISASKIDLDGYVTASQLNAEIADININIANTVATDTLEANSAIIGYMTYADEYCTWKSKTVQTSIPDFLKSTITLDNGNQMSVVTGWADAPSSYRSTIYYLSHS